MFRHCVVASTWAFEAQGPGSIPGGGANLIAKPDRVAEQLCCKARQGGGAIRLSLRKYRSIGTSDGSVA